MKKKFRFGINMLELIRIVTVVDWAMTEHVFAHLTQSEEHDVPVISGPPELFGK
jgi:hypothetical protein